MELKPIKNFKNTNLIYDINDRISKTKNKSDFTVFNELAAQLIIGEERFDDSCIIDGSGDGGVDFYFIDEEDNQEIILGQCKYVLKSSKEDIINTAEKVKRFISRVESLNIEQLNPFSSNLVLKLDDSLENIRNIKIYLVFSVNLDMDISLKNELNKIEKSIENIKQLKNNDIKVEIIFHNVQTFEELYESLDIEPGVSAKLELINKQSYFIIDKDKYNVIFAVIAGKSLWKLFKKLDADLAQKDAILSKNVRGYIKNRKIDDEIKKTILSEPNNFLVKNNGLTIISHNLEIDGVELKFKKMYIINGGQTSHLISTINNCDKLKNVDLFVKILDFNNLNGNDDLIIKIAESSNSQKPIRPLDIISYDKNVIKFKKNLSKISNVKYMLFDKRNVANPKIAKEKNKIPLYSLELIKIYFDFFALMPGKARSGLDTFLLSNPNYNFFKVVNILDKNNYDFFEDLMWIVEKIEEFYNKKNKDSKNPETINPNSVRDSNYYNLIKNGRHFLLSFIGAIFLKQAADLYSHKELMKFNIDNTAEEYTKKYQLKKILKSSFNSDQEFSNLLEDICEVVLNILGEQIPHDFAGKTKQNEFFYQIVNKYFNDYFYNKTKKDTLKQKFENIFEFLKFKENKKIDFL